jgi:hypothetical protein
LVDPVTGAHAASVEQLAGPSGTFADAQTAMILDPTSETGAKTLDLLKARLFIALTGHGYKRNQDGSAYSNREWPVIDLAISRDLRRAGRIADADALLLWITEQGVNNHLLVPELLDETTASYTGEVPMIGFGAGAYVSTLIDRSSTTTAGFTDGGAAADAGAQAMEAGPAIDASTTDASPDGGAGLDSGSPEPSDAGGSLRPDGAVAVTPITPTRSGCGCTAAGSPGDLLGAVALALLLCWRRPSTP